MENLQKLKMEGGGTQCLSVLPSTLTLGHRAVPLRTARWCYTCPRYLPCY